MPYLTVDCDLQERNLTETEAQRWLQGAIKGAIEESKARAREDGIGLNFSALSFEWVKRGHILRGVLPYTRDG